MSEKLPSENVSGAENQQENQNWKEEQLKALEDLKRIENMIKELRETYEKDGKFNNWYIGQIRKAEFELDRIKRDHYHY
jgi:hypothetical protein